MYKNLLNISARVDFQAALLAVCLTLCSAFAISYYYHKTTYDIITNTYIDRSDRLYKVVLENMPRHSFSQSIRAGDMNNPSISMQKTL